jgi:hypothetical protein
MAHQQQQAVRESVRLEKELRAATVANKQLQVGNRIKKEK